MLLLSFLLLATTALLGTALATLHLRADGARLPNWAFGAIHALLGLAGFAILFQTLGDPPRGAAVGVAGFGRLSAILLAMALLSGLLPLTSRLRRRRRSNFAIGIHATLAVSGVVILAAYTLVG